MLCTLLSKPHQTGYAVVSKLGVTKLQFFPQLLQGEIGGWLGGLGLIQTGLKVSDGEENVEQAVDVEEFRALNNIRKLLLVVFCSSLQLVQLVESVQLGECVDLGKVLADDAASIDIAGFRRVEGVSRLEARKIDLPWGKGGGSARR